MRIVKTITTILIPFILGALVSWVARPLYLSRAAPDEHQKPRNAASLTLGAVKTALKVVQDMRPYTLGKEDNKGATDGPCPLSSALRMQAMEIVADQVEETNSTKSLIYEGFDELFRGYGNCLTVDWHILKVIAFRESGLNSSVVNMLGFVGLFQGKKKYCETRLTPYGLQERCGDLTNPHTAIMEATAGMIQAQQIFRGNCGAVNPPEDLWYAMYLYQHLGGGAMRNILHQMVEKQGDCNHRKACQYIYEYWQSKDNFRSKKTAEEVCEFYQEP